LRDLRRKVESLQRQIETVQDTVSHLEKMSISNQQQNYEIISELKELHYRIVQPAEPETFDPESEDELYPEVKKFVLEKGRAAPSLLQYHFRIGYARAARLTDFLLVDGVIGDGEGQVPMSNIPFTWDELEERWRSFEEDDEDENS
jgi:DNA segregation ATPase FtsK/SpoIIIE-like protein